MSEAEQAYIQDNQPEGVPPLELTGERTLPDVPEENYWYRRHLAVYEWIAERVRRPAGGRPRLRRGLRLRPCSPARGRGDRGRRQPRGPRARRGPLPRAPNLRFERDLVENFDEPRRRRRLPADDRAHRRPRPRCSSGFAAARARSPTSRPRTGSPWRRPGAEKSDNPWHLREYTTGASTAALLEPHFARVEMLGLFHARKLRGARARDPARLGPGPPGARASPSRSTTASPRRSAPRTSACRPGDLDGALDFVAVCHA